MQAPNESDEPTTEPRPEVGAWFVTANPEVYRWERAFEEGSVVWDGARSAIAQRNIRMCRPGDPVIAYQGDPEKKVIGLGEIAEPPSPFAADGKEFFRVHIRTRERFSTPISRALIKEAVPSLSQFKLAQPSFTLVTPEEWERLQALFANPPPPPAPDVENDDSGSGSRSRRPNIPYSRFAEIRFTPVARGILEESVRIAQEERYTRWLSSALLICACVRLGRSTTQEWNAAAWLAGVIDADALRSATEKYFARHRQRQHGALPPKAFEYVSAHFSEVVDEAKRLAGSDEIGARHLIVALLTVGDPAQPPSSWRLLHDAKADRHRLLRELLDRLIESGYPEERARWEIERRRFAKTTAVIAGFSADDPSGQDCLNLDRDVTAMAALAVARSVEPPLAIGVFGQWGSGKSFFLRRLKDQIAKTADSKDEHYWSNVVQIEFNAWHYVDANLWASLAVHILQQLSVRSTPDRPEQDQACRAALALLQLADERYRKAVAREADLKVTVAAAEEKTAAAMATLKSDESALAVEIARNVLAEVDIKSALKGVPGADAALVQISAIDAGWKEAWASEQDLRRRLEGLASTGARVDLLIGSLLRGDGFLRRAVPWIVGTIAAVVLAWSFWGPWIRAHVLAQILSYLTPIGTAAVGILKWVSSQRGKISKLLEPLDAARRAIDAKIEAAEACRQQKIAQLQANLQQKRQELSDAAREKVQAQEAIAKAQQGARDAVSGKAIDAFVAQRVGSGEYQKYLGLVAVVRNDFQQLASMVQTHNRIQAGKEDPAVIEALKKQGVAIENLGINRIVLYIDDLDRCPSDRVVDVLQAIHLLLAFPIFVVVVAVDSRWMKRALAKEYPLLVGTGGLNGNGNSHAAVKDALTLPYATPEDYLEKIFQIPYWVPAMSATECGQLMRSLTAADNAKTRALDTESEQGRKGEDADVREKNPEAEKDRVEPEKKDPPQHEENPADEETDTEAAEPLNETPPVPSAERLQLSRGEVTAIEQLAGLVGRSPRAAKRFVNTYRVIRASLSESQLERVEAQRSYDSILFLLALGTGAPALAAAFESQRRRSTNPRAAVTALLKTAADDISGSQGSRGDQEAIERARRWLETVDHRWTSLTRQRVDEWVARVRRFSFAGEDDADEAPAAPVILPPAPLPAQPKATARM